MGALRTVYTELALKVQGFQAGIATARGSVKGFTSELDVMAVKHRQRFDEISNRTAIAGAGMLAVVGLLTKSSMEFDKQMSEVAATMSNDMPDGLNKLREAAIQAGKDTQFSATEAAKAEAELAKAGISTADIYGGALAGSLSLAAAGTIDLEQAATIAAQAMNIFGLKGAAVPHIADVLAAGANKSAADVHQLGEALRMGGLAAANAGLSLEDTVGVLAAFHDRALVGSDAGTSLKTMLMMLQSPSDKAASEMKRLGLNVYDANGNFIGAVKLAGLLQSQLGGLTQEERNAALATIFGSDATRAATVLYTQGATKIAKYIEAVDHQGAAAETARVKTDNLSGDVERLTGSLDTLFITSSGGTNGALRIMVQALDGLVTEFGKAPPVISSTLTLLVGVGGAGLLATSGLMKARQASMDALLALREMGPTGEKAAAGLSKLGSVAGKATLWAVAAYAAYEGMRAYVGFIDGATAPTVRNIDEMNKALKEFGRSGKVTGELQVAFGANLNDLQSQMKAFAAQQAREAKIAVGNQLDIIGAWQVESGKRAAGIGEATTKMSRQFEENIGSVDKALSDTVRAGGVTQAKIAFDQLGERWVAAGGNLDDLRAKLPQYTSAASDAAFASSAAGRGMGDAASNARTMTNGLEAAIAAGQTLTNVLDELNGAAVDWAGAEINAEAAIDDLAKTIKENGFTLDVNTEKGRQNKQQVLDGVEAAKKAAQAKYDATVATKGESGALADAKKTYDEYITRVLEALDPLHKHKQEVDALRTALAKIPDLTTTTVLVDFKGQYTGFKTAERAAAGNRWGGMYEKAATGTLREADVYSARNPGRYMIAEPGTGGEAFVPKSGMYGRSMSILSKAASWYGASVVPNQARPASSGGTTTIVHEHHHTLTLRGDSVLSGLRTEIELRGGNVQDVMGARR